MTAYVKHPVLGNRHVDERELPALVGAGWVRWPRTAEEKAGQVVAPVEITEEPPAEPVKRRPGRPKKV